MILLLWADSIPLWVDTPCLALGRAGIWHISIADQDADYTPMHVLILPGFNRHGSLPLAALNHETDSFDLTPTLTLLVSNKPTGILPGHCCHLCAPCWTGSNQHPESWVLPASATNTTPGTPKPGEPTHCFYAWVEGKALTIHTLPRDKKVTYAERPISKLQ